MMLNKIATSVYYFMHVPAAESYADLRLKKVLGIERFNYMVSSSQSTRYLLCYIPKDCLTIQWMENHTYGVPYTYSLYIMGSPIVYGWDKLHWSETSITRKLFKVSEHERYSITFINNYACKLRYAFDNGINDIKLSHIDKGIKIIQDKIDTVVKVYKNITNFSKE